jgi:hypothetical protein
MNMLCKASDFGRDKYFSRHLDGGSIHSLGNAVDACF